MSVLNRLPGKLIFIVPSGPHRSLDIPIGLEAARAERDTIKLLIRQGRDPVKDRQLGRAAAAVASGQTFESLAADWLVKQRKDWSSIHYDKSSRALERDVYPRLGGLPVRDIAPARVAGVVETIVKRGARDTAAKVLQHIGGIFRLAQARGMRDDNPADPVHEVLPGKERMGVCRRCSSSRSSAPCCAPPR